ncbi:hypothetical protein E2986_12131 [Frieseomelitta varia]|uniref:Uncharacterized protein n=1 Tax=Frieseomelitta varia TaxID=561572 RepID=A0A833S4N7_9HYME|nr:hypothetical protein E2986_12131 [Frieseomelitta varia]
MVTRYGPQSVASAEPDKARAGKETTPKGREKLLETGDLQTKVGNNVINLLFVLPGLYFNILKTEKILQFWAKYSRLENTLPTKRHRR